LWIRLSSLDVDRNEHWLHEKRCVDECSSSAAADDTLNWQKLHRYSFDVHTVPSAWIVRLLNTSPYAVCMSICPGETPVDGMDEGDGTETTRTPRRAGVTVRESVASRDIDMLLLRRDELLVETVLMLVGISLDCIPPEEAVAADADVLLTAWTSRIVFGPEELLPTGRLDSTRLLLLADALGLLLGRCVLTGGDNDTTAAAVAETIHRNISSVINSVHD